MSEAMDIIIYLVIAWICLIPTYFIMKAVNFERTRRKIKRAIISVPIVIIALAIFMLWIDSKDKSSKDSGTTEAEAAVLLTTTEQEIEPTTETIVSKEVASEISIPDTDFILNGNWYPINEGYIIYSYGNNDVPNLYIEIVIDPVSDPRTSSYTELLGVNYYGDELYSSGSESTTYYFVRESNVIQLTYTYKGLNDDNNIVYDTIMDVILLSHFKGDVYIGNMMEDESEYSYEYSDDETEVYDEDDLEAEGDPEAQIFYRQDYGPNGPSTWNEMCYDAHFARGVHVDPDTEEEYPMDGAYCPICNGVFVD